MGGKGKTIINVKAINSIKMKNLSCVTQITELLTFGTHFSIFCLFHETGKTGTRSEKGAIES
jgi:hypothetical protein